VSPSHSFSVLVRAEAPGRTSLKVCVQLEQIHASNTSLSDHLTDEIQILVNTSSTKETTMTSYLQESHREEADFP